MMALAAGADERASDRDTWPAQQCQEPEASSYTAAMQTIAVAATFIADPPRRPLQFWMDTLEFPVKIVIAPYAQVMQELLTPSSGFSSHRGGFNVLLIRLEDWVRDRLEQDHEQNLQHLHATQSRRVDVTTPTSPE